MSGGPTLVQHGGTQHSRHRTWLRQTHYTPVADHDGQQAIQRGIVGRHAADRGVAGAHHLHVAKGCVRILINVGAGAATQLTVVSLVPTTCRWVPNTAGNLGSPLQDARQGSAEHTSTTAPGGCITTCTMQADPAAVTAVHSRPKQQPAPPPPP